MKMKARSVDDENDQITVAPKVKCTDSSITALKGISFGVKKGETLVLLGAQSSGRSTIFKCMTGVKRPDQGTIHIFAKKPILTNFLYSPVSKHDLSFWLPKSVKNHMFEKDELSENIKDISDGLVIETKVVDKFFCELKDLHSQTIRLTYFNDKIVRSPDEIMKLHYKIGDLMSEKLNITVR